MRKVLFMAILLASGGAGVQAQTQAQIDCVVNAWNDYHDNGNLTAYASGGGYGFGAEIPMKLCNLKSVNEFFTALLTSESYVKQQKESQTKQSAPKNNQKRTRAAR